jgi:cyclopropane fatty-acyl-phospholipid synthase-like methyltransferase
VPDFSHWNERFSVEDYLFGTEPNAFLRAHARRLRRGWRALALADGEGRNGVWLAEQGLDVVSLDASPVALKKALRLARSRGVSITPIEADLDDWTWPEHAFDVVVAIFIQFADPSMRNRIFQGIKLALKPSGLLLMQGYRPEQLRYATGGPEIVENLYTEEILREAFADMSSLHIRAHDSSILEGSAHVGMSALIDVVATK